MINLGIKRDALSNGVNKFFKELPSNINKLSLEEYLMQRGYTPLQDDISLQDEVFNRYKVRRIETQFLPFVEMFKEDFVFEDTCLGWIKNINDIELDNLVPDSFIHNDKVYYFKNTFGRTFRNYFAEIKTIDEDKYYSMYNFDIENYDGTYTSRMLPSDQDEFWSFYYYFGYQNVVLDYELRDKN